MAGGRTDFRPDKWSAIGILTAVHTAGDFLEDPTTGYQYRFCKAAAALINDAFANGEVACYTTSAYVVTNDVSASLDGANYPKLAGIALGAVPEGGTADTQYLYVLGRGRHATAVIKTGEAAVAMDPLRPATDTDGAFIKISADGDTRIALAAGAVAMASQSGTSVAADIKAMGF